MEQWTETDFGLQMDFYTLFVDPENEFGMQGFDMTTLNKSHAIIFENFNE